jgi:nucleotide-binding universal stress UspA family protein
VAGVDGSPTADEALRWAIRQAELTGGTVDAVIAWVHPATVGAGAMGVAPMLAFDSTDYKAIAERKVLESISRVAGTAPAVPIRPRIASGNAAEILLSAAKDADLLVVGSRGHGGFAGALLGSVSQHCVQHAACPVVIIRGQHHSASTADRQDSAQPEPVTS